MGFLSNKIWVRIFLGHPVFGKHVCFDDVAMGLIYSIAVPMSTSDH